MELGRSKQMRYFRGQQHHLGHGGPFCCVIKTDFTHPSSYLEGSWPANHPVFVPRAVISSQRQHNHHATLIHLAGLSSLYLYRSSGGFDEPVASATGSLFDQP
jgi:hypothetical protein